MDTPKVISDDSRTAATNESEPVDAVRADCPDGQTAWFCCGYPTRCQRPSKEYEMAIGVARPT